MVLIAAGFSTNSSYETAWQPPGAGTAVGTGGIFSRQQRLS